MWLLCGLIHKPKNVTTISYALSSQSCDAVYLKKKKKKKLRQQHQFSLLLLASNPREAKTSNYCINYSNLVDIIFSVLRNKKVSADI